MTEIFEFNRRHRRVVITSDEGQYPSDDLEVNGRPLRLFDYQVSKFGAVRKYEEMAGYWVSCSSLPPSHLEKLQTLFPEAHE